MVPVSSMARSDGSVIVNACVATRENGALLVGAVGPDDLEHPTTRAAVVPQAVTARQARAAGARCGAPAPRDGTRARGPRGPGAGPGSELFFVKVEADMPDAGCL